MKTLRLSDAQYDHLLEALDLAIEADSLDMASMDDEGQLTFEALREEIRELSEVVA